MNEMKYFFGSVLSVFVILVVFTVWRARLPMEVTQQGEKAAQPTQEEKPEGFTACKDKMHAEFQDGMKQRGMQLVLDRTVDPPCDCVNEGLRIFKACSDADLPPRSGYVRDQNNCFLATSELVYGRYVPKHLAWAFTNVPCDSIK